MSEHKFGARVYFYDNVILVKQTVRREGSTAYVLDADAKGHKEKHVKPGDAAALGEAVLAAGRGELISRSKVS